MHPSSSRPALAPRSAAGRTLRWLIVSQVLFALSLSAWALLFFGSFAGAQTPLALAALWCYPAVSLGAIARSWLAFARRRYRRATLWTAVPLTYAVAIMLYLAV